MTDASLHSEIAAADSIDVRCGAAASREDRPNGALHDASQRSELSLVEQERSGRLMAMGQMAASLAHEIRNPLGSMELFCTLLKKDLAEHPVSLNLAEQIHQGIRRLDRIISNCLQFARDVTPKRKTIKGAQSVLEEAISFVQGESERHGVDVTLVCSGEEREIQIDPYLIGQAVANLLRNGVEAAAECRPGERSVEIVSSITAAEWVLEVRDSGPGIPTEQIERIFDPFFTTKSDGTGLGLSIVHSIVCAHRGTITFARSQLAGPAPAPVGGVEVASSACEGAAATNGTCVIVRIPRKSEALK